MYQLDQLCPTSSIRILLWATFKFQEEEVCEQRKDFKEDLKEGNLHTQPAETELTTEPSELWLFRHQFPNNPLPSLRSPMLKSKNKLANTSIVQELCESRGGRPGLSVLMSLLVSLDVKIYWTVLRHWSQLVPNMSTDIWGHRASTHYHPANTSPTTIFTPLVPTPHTSCYWKRWSFHLKF